MARRAISVGTSLLGIVLMSGGAHAQKARDNPGAPNAQLVQQMQQLGSERTALQAENQKLKKELEDLKRERDGLKAKAQSGEARTSAGSAALRQRDELIETRNRELGVEKGRQQELVARFRELATNLREVELKGAGLQQSLIERERQLSSCTTNNKALYTLNGELLDRLEQRGVFAKVLDAEPFTRLKRTQLENLIDDYRDKASLLVAPAVQAN